MAVALSSEVRQALVILWRAAESARGNRRPSSRLVCRWARDLGLKFRDQEARDLLSSFAQASRDAAATQDAQLADARGRKKHACGTHADAKEARPGRNRDAASPTRDKVLLFTNQDPDSLRSSALSFGRWPDDVEDLRRIASHFVGFFANCRDSQKAVAHLAAYIPVLAQMRSRGVNIEAAWKACEDALAANGGKPLFGSSIKNAMSFLPARLQLHAAGSPMAVRTVTLAELAAAP